MIKMLSMYKNVRRLCWFDTRQFHYIQGYQAKNVSSKLKVFLLCLLQIWCKIRTDAKNNITHCKNQRRHWCDVMWCDVMWCDVMWCDVMWCDVMEDISIGVKSVIFGQLTSAARLFAQLHAGTRKSLSGILAASTWTVNRICLKSR